MDVVITNSAREIIYAEKAASKKATTDASSIKEISDQENYPFWQVKKQEIDLPDIFVGTYKINVLEEIHIQAYDPSPMPGLFFLQRGVFASRLYDQKNLHHVSSGQHSILFNPFCAEDTHMKQQSNLTIFVVLFSPDYFLRLADSDNPVMSKLAESIITNKPATFQQPGNLAITSKMQEVIGEIKNSRCRKGVWKLFLQAKVIELLTLQCAQIEEAGTSSSRSFKLSPADLSKIYLARDIITQEVINPPSLTVLARLTGLNEFKLKAGFKSVFSNSVFGYFNDYRLDLGKKQVLKNNKSLTEIAYESGYASLSNFSNAFKKKYGVSPLKIR